MDTVTISEAARRLGISRKTVHRRIDAGQLRAVDTPDGRRVVLPGATLDGHARAPEHTPAHVPAQDEAQAAHTQRDELRARLERAEQAHTQRDELRARLERAEQRIDQLLDVVQEQNKTIQAQTIRLAQLEGRMLDASTAPHETPQKPTGAPEPVAVYIPPPRRRWTLRALYEAWRGVR